MRDSTNFPLHLEQLHATKSLLLCVGVGFSLSTREIDLNLLEGVAIGQELSSSTAESDFFRTIL